MWSKGNKKLQNGLSQSISSNAPLYKNLKENVDELKKELDDCSDLIVRFLKDRDHLILFAVIFIDGIANTGDINEQILEPLLKYKTKSWSERLFY